MSEKHTKRFRRMLRQSVQKMRAEGQASETVNSTATIYARHWVVGGPLTPMQALRSLAMVTGVPLVRRQQPPPNNKTRVLMWPPAQGETWLGRAPNGWVR